MPYVIITIIIRHCFAYYLRKEERELICYCHRSLAKLKLIYLN